MSDKPTGVWGKKECDETNQYYIYADGCHAGNCKCKGTKIIYHELTPDECVEMVKMLLDKKGYLLEHDNGDRLFLLPDGTRVEREK